MTSISTQAYNYEMLFWIQYRITYSTGRYNHVVLFFDKHDA